MERQARIKNHPNVVIKDVQRNEKKPSFGNPFEEDTVLKGDVEMENIHLMDISLQDKPDKIHRVYALVDEQSNASMITPDLANKLGINSKKEKYFLSTCSVSKEVKYGRRVPGVIATSVDGKSSKLPI